MKLKHRKGSTLALTLMIFAVLMIFATFILSFMVTENKQAMYYQNKTQAYYLARSGAVAAEEAVLKMAQDNDKKYDFIENRIPNNSIDSPNVNFNSVSFDFADVDVKLYKIFNGVKEMKLEGKTVDANDYTIVIESSATINNSTETVEILIPTIIANTLTKNTDAVLVYLENASEDLKNLKIDGKAVVAKGDPDSSQYQEHDKTEGDYIDDTRRLPSGDKITLNGNYYVNGDLDLTGKEINLTGITNIYIKGGLKILGGDTGKDNTIINYNEGSKKDNLKFFIYNQETSYSNSLQIGKNDDNDKDLFSRATFYVKSGVVDIHVHKLDFESDIFTNGDEINITSHSNSNEHIDLIGTFIAPNAQINLGKAGEKDKVAINIKGLMVGEYIWYNGKDLGKLFLDATGINDNLIPYSEEFITSVGKGYFR